MRQYIFTLGAVGFCASTLFGQVQTSGKITYEGMRHAEPVTIRIGGDAQGFSLPDSENDSENVASFIQKLVFSGTMAIEEHDLPPQRKTMRRTKNGGKSKRSDEDSENTLSTIKPSFEERIYFDLANRQRIEVVLVKKDTIVTEVYQSKKPIPAPNDWTAVDKTRKIAGYTCHKATATRRRKTYTIWYTTNLPFTYSPIVDLTPPKGVVLQIESDIESYLATGVSMEAITEASVQPPKGARSVSAEEINEIRKKGMADFHQRMFQNMSMPGRN